MRPNYIHLPKSEIGNPVNKLRESFNRKNEAIRYHNDKVGVVFIGDSITDYWDLDSYFKLNNGKRIINRGIGNDQTQFVRHRFEADALQLQPDWIILSIGINNTKILDEDQSITMQNKIKHQITSDIEAMIQLSKSHDTNIAVSSITSTHRPHLKGFKTRSLLVKTLNQQIKKLCETYQIPYIDYYTPMTFTDHDMDYLKQTLTDDGLHPHVLGYDMMTEAIISTFQSLYPIQKRG